MPHSTATMLDWGAFAGVVVTLMLAVIVGVLSGSVGLSLLRPLPTEGRPDDAT